MPFLLVLVGKQKKLLDFRSLFSKTIGARVATDFSVVSKRSLSRMIHNALVLILLDQTTHDKKNPIANNELIPTRRRTELASDF